MKRIIKMNNTAGYNNSQSGIETANNATKGVSAKVAQKAGALESSKADINIARFDTVPLVRFFETNNWYGKNKEGDE